MVQIGTFISFADDEINKLVVIMVIWADTFVSTGGVDAGGGGNATSVVDGAFIDIDTCVQLVGGSIPSGCVVCVVVEAVQSG